MCPTSEAEASSDAVQDKGSKANGMTSIINNDATPSTTETTATAEIAATVDSTETRVNWLDRLPRELRNGVYAHALPHNIVFHDGVLCSDVADVLSMNRRSRQEGRKEMEKMRDTRHFVFEFSSNVAMLNYLDALPDNTLESYTNLTITVKGAYNGHSTIYSNNNGCHRTNISPTLRREGDEVWFEVIYAWPDSRDQPFYQRELQFSCPTIQAQFERLTGMAFTAGVVELRLSTHSHEEDVPHVRAYRLSVWNSLPRGTTFYYSHKLC